MEQKKGFLLDTEKEYFKNHGVDVMAFADIYPAGHQSGVSMIMHGRRILTNGDVRFEQTPGQWQPTPKQLSRVLHEGENSITTTLRYPNDKQHLRGFNPMIYPDCNLEYQVKVTGEESDIKITVDLQDEIPELFAGKLCFNLEILPTEVFGKPWIMDGKQGIFPRQANGPVLNQPANIEHTAKVTGEERTADLKRLADRSKGYNPIIADDLIAEPYACGHRFTVRPDDPYRRFTIENKEGVLKLYDGRMNHNNGWFVVSCEIPQGKTKGAVELTITPSVVKDWKYQPIVQTSQVGYHPSAPKVAIMELDASEPERKPVILQQITEDGAVVVREAEPTEWGSFLRYQYLKFDFSDITKEGLYQVVYGDSTSSVFRIAEDIYDRGVWQPVLECFLPVQMCHMRVNEKYRVWHDLCHEDDAEMAPLNFIHFDGYSQGPSTMTKYQPGDHVPGLNQGGWHDAGDFDLRVESQSGESYNLSLAYEQFRVDYDMTSIDQEKKVTEIHQPDGKNDILQQIEHGLLTVLGGYRALGRLYRGIICRDLRQYVLLGDPSAMTKNQVGDGDDRWVFTEDNPPRELLVAAHLAASARAMKGYNDALSEEALKVAKELYQITDIQKKSAMEEQDYDPVQVKDLARVEKIHAAAELLLTTGEEEYAQYLVSETDFITKNLKRVGWMVSRVKDQISNRRYQDQLYLAMQNFQKELEEQSRETPYGIPYRPYIWGAGWEIQRMGVEYYFLHQAYPELFSEDMLYHALDFVLGCHPGSNTESFASGVGARSATVAYGMNRADWSYIPGGVISGTALIRPDFPELLEFPFLWQQGEYVMGGGSSHYMFLVLAAQKLLKEK